ncbi:MAG: enoyl-CoA hydratase/isomerase family protein [Bosea sp. (in: a-proteobacteria)]
MSENDEIICKREGAAGVVTLNRPQALNALTLSMVRGLAKALDEWEQDGGVTRIIIEGAGEKAFCAGGDIRAIHDQGKAGRHDEALTFWREEYILNARIKTYPKPFIALIDGIVMGGGVGVSLHGSHVVAGERFLFAMPEVGIGFFPDVGATWMLPRLPGAYGRFIALTGERVRQGDALELGLATAAVGSADMAPLKARLIAGEDVDAAIAACAMPVAPGPLMAEASVIGQCFSAETVESVIERLDVQATKSSEFARKIATSMRGKSPTSLCLAHEQMKRGSRMDFAEAMRTEYRIVSRICHGTDFYEGVRAVIIDKDNAPRWSPATLADIEPAMIARYFAPLGGDELPLEG